MDIGAALTIALLAALLGQVWAAQVRLAHQLCWLSAVLLLNAMTLPAAMLLFGDSHTALGMAAGFGAILVASASGMGALIWLYRIEKLGQSKAMRPAQRSAARAPIELTQAESAMSASPQGSSQGSSQADSALAASHQASGQHG
ncbi:MAG: hypothetical protein PHF20_03225 [Halothiobacillaceae bacterium]|nr:hypothetical protein [Halothiobacillaceae bacterium]